MRRRRNAARRAGPTPVPVVKKPYQVFIGAEGRRPTAPPPSGLAKPFWETGKKETPRAKAQRERDALVRIAALRAELRDLDVAAPGWRERGQELQRLERSLGLRATRRVSAELDAEGEG